jgi:hypothetical protein
MGFSLRSKRAMIDGINRESALKGESKVENMYFHILYSYKRHSACVEFTGEKCLEENSKVKKIVALLTL